METSGCEALKQIGKDHRFVGAVIQSFQFIDWKVRVCVGVLVGNWKRLVVIVIGECVLGMRTDN